MNLQLLKTFNLIHSNQSLILLNHFSTKINRLPFDKCIFIDQDGKNQGEIKIRDIPKQFPFNEENYKLRVVNQNPPTCRLVNIQDLLIKTKRLNSTDNSTGKIKDKDIYFGTATEDHDLLIKCTKINEWLAKNYNVRIIIEKKGAISEQRDKSVILGLVLQQIEGKFQQIGKELTDENRIIFSVKGLGIKDNSCDG